MADLIITAPVKGWAAPLEEVPDLVFADRMMGDGVAIHPTGSTIHAPCDGTVIAIHAARHAVTLRSEEGAEILIHTGLDTVALGGEGFKALVTDGATVSRGDPLIEFDIDTVAQRARSLVTPVIITNADDFQIVKRTTGQMVGVGEALMTVKAIGAGQRIWVSDDAAVLSRSAIVPLVHGIHARPAARLGECARNFEAEVEIVKGDKRANVRSAVSLMGLGVKMGDQITIEGRGNDARAAIEAVGDLLTSGMGETGAETARSPEAIIASDVPEGTLAGVTASSGIAIGKTAWLAVASVAVDRDGKGIAEENSSLSAALSKVRQSIANASAKGNDAQRNILEAHLAFLDDADLLATAHKHVGEGRSAAFAWLSAIGDQIAILQNSGNARMAERSDDLKDLEQQVLLALTGGEAPIQNFAPDTILLAEDLLPSQIIALDLQNVKGIALAHGGPTSHVAILAASMNVPSLAAMGDALKSVAAGSMVVLDADAGLLHVNPDDCHMAAHRARLAQASEREADALKTAQNNCHSADGTRIEIFANLGSIQDARLASELGAEGSGLLRTEFLFMGRASAPDEDEQLTSYQGIADAMEGKPIIVRLLDIGGDKPAPYLNLGAEKNPVLGLRGIRVGLAHPELLESQIRAILRVQPLGQCRIMVPMIASLSELRPVQAVVEKVRTDLGITDAIKVGVMIETPAAAATADLIATEADFLSVGTNDLTQYALAMDRENPSVAGGIDALHPAVLRLIAQSCKGGAQHERQVGVCGGLASDPLGIPLLIGLGVTELSVTAAFVPKAKAMVRQLNIPACAKLAEQAMRLSSAADIRLLVRKFIEELN